MKENNNSPDPNTGWNARRSLNLLKYSLNRPMMLPHIEDDEDEEMEIVEEAEQVLLEATEACKNMETGRCHHVKIEIQFSTFLYCLHF